MKAQLSCPRCGGKLILVVKGVWEHHSLVLNKPLEPKELERQEWSVSHVDEEGWDCPLPRLELASWFFSNYTFDVTEDEDRKGVIRIIERR